MAFKLLKNGRARVLTRRNGRAALVAAAICVATAPSPSFAADRTIDADYVLEDDETVDGTLTVDAGVTVDLNGHNLTVKGLAGDGTITAGLVDLTAPDPLTNRVTWTTHDGERKQGPLNPGDSTSLLNLFNNKYVYVSGDPTTRVLVQKDYLPLAVTYDFGADTPKKVDLYKVYVGPNSRNKRGPKEWTFEGSNDKETWTPLDSRNGETWTTAQDTRAYTFENAAAYRYYRITFTASSDTSTASGGPYLEFVQLEYFDSSAVPENPPELRVNVPVGVSVTNSTVAIGGSVRLVKEGAGEFVAAKAGQTYSGGTSVKAGTLKPYSTVDWLLGPNGSDVFVDSGAVFDINGNARCSLYHYRMNGGTALNSGAALGLNDSQLGDMTLTADSFLDSTHSLGFLKAASASLTIDLGGQTLQVTVGQETRFVNADITNGTLRLVRGTGGQAVYFTKVASRAPTATLDMDSHVGIYYDLPVSNLLLRTGFTAHTGEGASGKYQVSGTFRTETTNFPLVRMMDGSTVDLTSWSGTFNANSTSTNPNNNRLMFADGATVTIDLAGRSLEVGERIIAWDEMPNNVTFQFDAATAASGVAPVVADGGLLYGSVPDAVEQAWWTGAAGDGDTANPENWLCKNAVGGTVEGAVPSAVTHIYLEGALNALTVPTGLAHRVCTLTNATLAGDCDLRALGATLEVAQNATIDLNGHRLYVPAGALAGTCTVKDTEIGHADDLTTTDASRVTSSAFNSGNTPASNLFNNNYVRGMNNTQRVLVPEKDWQLKVTYDFGEGTVVDAYRMWNGGGKDTVYANRMPRRWKFEGANDNANWTLLDRRNSEMQWPTANSHRTYSFANTTAYRYYRITFEENNGPDGNGNYLELVQLEYFNLKPTQGELHIDTTGASVTLDLSGLSLGGNMRVFVEGSGNVRFVKAGQTYVGGTEIAAGNVLAGDGGASVQDADLFGEKGSEVVVRGDNSGNSSATSGVVNFGGRTGYTGYKYVLDGGAIMNSGDDVVADLRLDSDSHMKTTSDVTLDKLYGISSVDRAAYADLGGHELSVRVTSGRWFGLQNATLENGKLNIVSGGWFATTNSVVATNNVSLTVNGAASHVAGEVSVTDYTCLYANATHNSGTGVIDVYGTFCAPRRLFHGARLHDGATIDLCSNGAGADPLPTVALFTASQTGDKTLRFEPGATIGVKLGSRQVEKGAVIISWTAETAPDATVKFVCVESDRKYRFVKESDGLRCYPPAGFMVIVK